jgi:hypothetical protein
MPTPLSDHAFRAIAALGLGGGYSWTPGNGGGCTRNLTHAGTMILRAGPPTATGKPATYCCGVTLEILWRAWEASGLPMLGGISADAARDLRRAWFCIGTRKGPVDALVPRGLGVEVPIADALPGDFAQLWRGPNSGHSVVVVGHEHGAITYFSTQRSTGGLGFVTERMPREIYVCRAIAPDLEIA